jgi:hypothetical protein
MSFLGTWFGSGEPEAPRGAQQQAEKRLLPNGRPAPVYCATCLDSTSNCATHGRSTPTAQVTASSAPIAEEVSIVGKRMQKYSAAGVAAVAEQRPQKAESVAAKQEQREPERPAHDQTPKEFRPTADLLAECAKTENYDAESRDRAAALAKIAERLETQAKLLFATNRHLNLKLIEAHNAAVERWITVANEHLVKIVSFREDTEFCSLCSSTGTTSTTSTTTATTATTTTTPLNTTTVASDALAAAESAGGVANEAHNQLRPDDAN